MKKSSVLLLTLLVVVLAKAENPKDADAPAMSFRTIPLENFRSTEHRVTPYRLFDKMVVTVWDPVICGQHPDKPTFSIDGDKLYLRYDLTPDLSGDKLCTLVSEFDVTNLPHRDLEVNFAGGPEPYVISKLKKCPNYVPKGDDIYECLAPDKH